MDLEGVLDQALALGDEGRWDEMAQLLDGALAQADDDPYLLCWAGVAQRELGNDTVAYDFFRRSFAEEPMDPQLLALIGSGLAAFDDPEAENALRAAALTGPDVASARLQYGAYLARQGLFDEALAHLRAAATLDPEDPTMRGELGIAWALKGDYDAAGAAMESALELAPDDSWTRVLLGLIHAERGRMEEAAEALIQAAEERPEDGEAQVLAALAAAVVGWDDAAQNSLARAEYASETVDEAVREEADERIGAGAREAEEMLLDLLGPSVLRERLAQPL